MAPFVRHPAACAPTVAGVIKPSAPSARDLSVYALATTILLWASAFVGIRAIGDHFSPGSLTLGRLLVGSAVLTLIAWPRRERLPNGRPTVLVAVYGIAWFAAYNLALNAGERDIDAGTSALIINIAPVLVAIFAGILLKEGFPKFLLIGMAVAFSGVVVVAISADRDSTAVATASATGVILCVCGAVFAALGILTQKLALSSVTPVMSVWVGCLVGTILCLPFAPQLIDEMGAATTEDIAWLVYLGVFPTAIGFSTWAYALKRLSAGQTASTTYLVPAVATLISWIVLDEVPAVLAYVGGALCLVGVLITRRPSHAKRPAPGSAPVPERSDQ